MNLWAYLRAIIVFCIFSPSSLVFAQHIVGDYDGDGLEDMSVALVDRRNGTTAWATRLSSGAPNRLWSFALPGDALISGRYFAGDGRTYPGVVFVRDIRLPLEWRISNPAGTQIILNYGIPGDTVMNQGDVDCDGTTDLIVARNGRSNYFPGFRLWYIALSGGGGQIIERVFGLTSDRIGVADVDGDGCSELIALRGSTYVWYAMRALSTEFVRVTQWGLPGDIPLLPRDYNNDGVPDYIIARRTGYIQLGYVRYSDSSYDVIPLGLDSSIPLMGRFTRDGNAFAWHQRDAGLAAIRSRYLPRSEVTPDQIFAFGIAANAIIRPDGTVVQPNEDGRYGSWDSPRLPPPPSGQCDRPPFPDGRGGWVWKPYREGGSGAGDATTLIPPKNGSLPNRVIYIGSSGSEIGRARLRYHYGDSGRSVWDANQSNSELARSAPFLVQVSFSDGTCSEITVPNPYNRYD